MGIYSQALAKRIHEVRMECAKAVCRRCQKGSVPTLDDNGQGIPGFKHEILVKVKGEGKMRIMLDPCTAAGIWDIIESERV